MNSPDSSILDRPRRRPRPAQVLLLRSMRTTVPVLVSFLAASVTAGTPNISPTQVLQAVTCASESQCWVVGYSQFDNSRPDQTLILRLRKNGKSWAVKISPNTSPLESNRLSGVACASESQCWAVGGYSTNISHSLIEQWDGKSWSIVNSPDFDGTLTAVACSSASDCWAVGYDSGLAQPVFERWNGNSWAMFTGVLSYPAVTGVESIACSSSTDCWATGFSNGGAGLFHWDGAEWASAEIFGDGFSVIADLLGVSCSAGSCQAVGWYLGFYFDNLTHPLAFSVKPPFLSNSYAQATNSWSSLSGVACDSAANCWAVGGTAIGGGQALIERWNGSAWSIVSSPIVNGPNSLKSVACSSVANCWAVGGYQPTSGLYQPLFEHWDGTAWSVAK